MCQNHRTQLQNYGTTVAGAQPAQMLRLQLNVASSIFKGEMGREKPWNNANNYLLCNCFNAKRRINSSDVATLNKLVCQRLQFALRCQPRVPPARFPRRRLSYPNWAGRLEAQGHPVTPRLVLFVCLFCLSCVVFNCFMCTFLEKNKA